MATRSASVPDPASPDVFARRPGSTCRTVAASIASSGQEQQSLDDVAQLADVAGPRVASELLQRVGPPARGARLPGSRSSRAPVPSFRFDPLSCRPPVLSTGRATGSPVVEVLWKWVRGMRAGETRVTRRTPVCGVTWAEIG